MVTTMKVVTERVGDYYAVEVYSDDNRLLIRVGFDHEPTQEEIDALLQSLSGGDEAWQP
jgi:selenocysteine lyase/cysteine desulfurase